MNSTLLLVLVSILLLFLLVLGLMLFRERVELQLDQDKILLRYPFSKRLQHLEQDLSSWKIQQAHYLRWGVVYSINMLFSDGRRAAVNSRINPENFESLYKYLNSQYASRREADDVSMPN
ncbi:hypothetical protein [Cesiribacter andamanensis]|uniref:DUF304 domain-containing protein n=1 Tax=Cesiribacter andamanensis AMV16 TaxID=1279009 RepID=M7MXD1_9BACT|nr:hypothetical protein [Cesiribacter andamanensis]EMR01098.1 hypothetical protein ADICEAN_03769 [Cesiribacter andamanensis AMV16]